YILECAKQSKWIYSTGGLHDIGFRGNFDGSLTTGQKRFSRTGESRAASYFNHQMANERTARC
ncbi:hypothetical protein RCCGEPOP_28099, partial [Rhizobium sp. Pop5]